MTKGLVGTGVTIGSAVAGKAMAWTAIVTLGFQWASYAVSIVVGILTAIWWLKKIRKGD